MDEAVKLCKKEMDIKKLKSKINESNIQEDDLVVSHKILDLILRHTNIKSVSLYKNTFFLFIFIICSLI